MAHEYEVLGSEEVYAGHVISLRKDTVAMPGGGESVREVVVHPGAVGIVAVDDDDRVVMLRQYRHPARAHLLELPAGLRDQDGEPPLTTAERELAEEVGLAAERWALLSVYFSTPGFCTERVGIYLAEGLSEVDRPEGFVVEHEEADMTVERVPFADAVRMVLTGEVRNSVAVIGLLAAHAVRTGAGETRPADTDF